MTTYTYTFDSRDPITQYIVIEKPGLCAYFWREVGKLFGVPAWSLRGIERFKNPVFEMLEMYRDGEVVTVEFRAQVEKP